MAIAIPKSTYARIDPRSGFAIKQSIGRGAGVVDADYHGEVGVILFNNADDEFHVCQGDWIAQLILERIKTPTMEVVDELDDTSRATTGFGTTGIQPD